MSVIARRKLLIGGPSSLLLGGCDYKSMQPAFGEIFKAGDFASYHAQGLLLSGHNLAREYAAKDISRTFPVVGKTPKSGAYAKLVSGGFDAWRLPVEGLVERPRAYSLADLQSLPRRTQITSHSCQEGWTAIGQWTGVPLATILAQVGLKPEARFVFFFSHDGWWDSVHLFDALHPQTILAYGMNGGPVPVAHGAPVRLRVERHLGYKSLKFLDRILVTDSLSRVGNGLGSSGAAYGYSWNSGI